MTIQEQLTADLKPALREKDEARKSAIRMALAALKNARVAKNADLTADEELAALSQEIKRRRDALVQFRDAGRQDLVAGEEVELRILEAYLPPALGDKEVVEMARAAIAEAGASSLKEMGQVMRVLMPRVRGRADGQRVSEIVRGLLTAQS